MACVRLVAGLVVALSLLAAGCGGSSSNAKEEPAAKSATAAPAAGTLEALWRAPGADVALINGTADFAPGERRYSFLIVDNQSRIVTRPTAKVWLSRGLKQKPFMETTATSEKIGVDAVEEGTPRAIFVTTLDLPDPGKYWVLAEPVGGRKIQAIGNVVVGKRTSAPDVGEPAVASKTPTLTSAGGDLAKLTTSKPPDTELLRTSVAEALSAGDPFVVTFATPQFCTTRTCGPVVEVVDAARTSFTGEKQIRWIHVEIYKDNDPTKGQNRWVTEWNLPTEPFTFLVGADGKVKARFEGTFSVRELKAAVREHLLP